MSRSDATHGWGAQSRTSPDFNKETPVAVQLGFFYARKMCHLYWRYQNLKTLFSHGFILDFKLGQ